MTNRPTAPLLDLADLVSRCGDDAQLACELLTLYGEARTQGLARIDTALASGDLEAVSMASHSLAGTFANIGLATPAAMARSVRVAATAGDVAAARATFASLAALLPAIDADVAAALSALGATQ